MKTLCRMALLAGLVGLCSGASARIVVFTGPAVPTGPQFEFSVSPTGEYVAYATNIGGNYEIYVSNIPGNFVANISNHPALDRRPRWANTADRLLFESFRDGSCNIYRWDFGAQQPVDLTRNPSVDTAPIWAPDDSFIVYLGEHNGKPVPMIMEPDGSDPRPLLNEEAMAAIRNFAPYHDFSADGKTYVFAADGDMWTLDLERGELYNFMETEYIDVHLSYSPVEDRIAFLAFEPGFQPELHIIDPDGRNVKRVTNNIYGEFPPSWSPDGSRVLFTSFMTGLGWELFAYDVAEDELTMLTGPETVESRRNIMPQWFPDGETVAFLARMDGRNEICIRRPDGAIVGMGLNTRCRNR